MSSSDPNLKLSNQTSNAQTLHRTTTIPAYASDAALASVNSGPYMVLVVR